MARHFQIVTKGVETIVEVTMEQKGGTDGGSEAAELEGKGEKIQVDSDGRRS